MWLFYFSYKQVKHGFSLLRAYAIICGRFNITVQTETTCTPKIKVNLPVFDYNDSHVSLNLLKGSYIENVNILICNMTIF